MEKRLSDELTLLTTRLMMSSSKREIISLSGEFGRLIERVMEQEAKAYNPAMQEKSVTATIKFKKEEVANMAKTFKREFIANGLVARVIKRQSGKRTFVYEIRYRRNGYNISASSTDIEKAKKKFLDMTRPENISKYAPRPEKSGLHLFHEIATEWFAWKKGKINDRTYSNYESYYRRFMYPALGETSIFQIRTADVDKVLKNKSERQYEDLRTVFNSIFKYAIASGIITHNPVTLVPFKKAKRKDRRALTAEEQRHLLQRLELPEFFEYRATFLIMLYFGLRPCELEDTRFEGDFLIARNAKRKGGKIEYKKIPAPKQAREKLNFNEKIKTLKTPVLNRIFQRAIEDDTLTQYYLRHTFCTTCQKSVRQEIVAIWMGDSPERLIGKVYTHFSDDFMREQMAQVKFDV